MEEDNNIKNFSAVDVERYHKGLMSPREMHALEKAAMDDPFLADALEGYSVTGVNAEKDIADLENRLAKRTESKKMVALPKRYYWMRVAAMIIVIGGAGMLTYTLLNKRKNESVAQVNKQETNQAPLTTSDSGNRSDIFLNADSIQSSKADISSLNRSKSIISSDTIKSFTFKTSAGSEEKLKTDTISFRANTTRDLASGDLVAAPAVNNTAPLALEKKEAERKNDSLIIIAQDKRSNKAAEEYAFKDVVPSKGDDVAFRSANREKRSAQPSGISSGIFSDSIIPNYKSLNIFRGRVTDADNNAISFANITINNVNVGTYADAKGYFNLVSTDSILNVNLKAVGFNNSQALLRKSISTNQVVLQEDKSIDAIVMSNKKPNANRRDRSAEMVLTEPEPNDGWAKYDDYLANNLKVPDEKGNIQKQSGEVELSFDINSDGDPVNIKVTKSLCKECDAEAIRLVKEGPKWKKKKKKEKGRVTISF